MIFSDSEHLFRNHEIWAKTIDFADFHQNRGILWILVFFFEIKRFDFIFKIRGLSPTIILKMKSCNFMKISPFWAIFHEMSLKIRQAIG